MTKKVLIFRSKLLPYSETFIKAQAEALKAWDYMYLTEKQLKALPIDESKVLILPKKSKTGFVSRVFGWFFKSRYEGLVAHFRTLNFNLIHAHFGTDAIKVADLADALGIPMVVTLHGFDINIHRQVWESGAKGHRKKEYPEKLLALADKPKVYFIAVSEAIKKQAIAFGIPADKVTVQYIGIDLNKFKPEGHVLSSKKIVYVGRMVEKKGAKILIRAFEKLSKLVPNAQLVMIGDGDDLESNRQLATELNVHVDFAGVKTASEVAAYLNSARIFCLPSITAENGDAEGMGLVILEAQACGVPVVTSARGGATEGIIHGETGFSFAEGDVDALTTHLIRLLTDDELVARFSIAAIQHCHNQFDLNRCTAMLEEFYDQFLVSH